MRATSCPNRNHCHDKAPVRFCPNCGEVVNARIPVNHGCQQDHARRRRDQEKFCVDCGEQLRV